MKKCITVFFILLSLAITILGAVVVINNPYSGDDYFIKTATMDDRIYCLTNKGLFLEYSLIKEKFTLVEENVRDFYAYDQDCYYLLYNDKIFKNFVSGREYYLPEADRFEESSYRTKNGDVFYCNALDREWYKINTDSIKASPNQLSAVVLDEKNILRNFFYDTEENFIISENVIDFYFGDATKTYYFPDLIYVTKEGKSIFLRVNDIGTNDFELSTYSIDEKVSKVCCTSEGYYIVECEDNCFLFGNINQNFEPLKFNVNPGHVSMLGKYFSLIDEDNPRVIYHCTDAFNGKLEEIEYPNYNYI